MGLKDPIGKIVRYWGSEAEVVGVARNFNFESLHESIKPCLFRVYPLLPNFIVRIEPGMEQNTIYQIEELFRSISGDPFDYKFLNENYDSLYISEQRASILSLYFAGISMVIACLGILGLAIFTAERRKKEIGIRKVLGASVSQLWLLLSKSFIVLVLISCVIASPIAFYFLQNWLMKYDYRIGIGPVVFIMAAIAAIVITIITISFQAIKAAIANPVKSLRTE
jgi:ABC-type antimicrobial peptide transport system permease subunit